MRRSVVVLSRFVQASSESWSNQPPETAGFIWEQRCRPPRLLVVRRERDLEPAETPDYMGHSGINVTIDLHAHLCPGNETEASALLDAYLERAFATA